MWKDIYKLKGIVTGIIFWLVSILISLTIIGPLFFIVPLSGVFNAFFSVMLENSDATNSAITIALLVTFTGSALVYFRYVFKQSENAQNINTGLLVFFMILQLFIIHPIGFILYTFSLGDISHEGQLGMEAGNVFPLSGFAFLVLGIINDLICNKEANQH